MKYLSLLIIIIFISSCQYNKQGGEDVKADFSFFVGTYSEGESQGIYKYVLHTDGSMDSICLSAKTKNASFLTQTYNNNFIIAVSEIKDVTDEGAIATFSKTGDSLAFLSRSTSGGAHPCFVSVNENGDVLVANYSSGNVGLFKINNLGIISPLLDLQQHFGDSVNLRQDAPHAHSAWFVPNSNNVISVDLGTNQLLFSKLDTISNKLLTNDQLTLNMDDGAGPRHLVFHPNNKWIYVINELNSSITLVLKKEGKFEKLSSFSTLPNNYKGESFCADIHISSDGKFVYASNRGHNSIAIFKVNFETGFLNLIANENVHGNWPRNFSLSPNENYLLVANRRSNNIVSFKRDKTNGLLTFVDEIKAPSPVCILFE